MENLFAYGTLRDERVQQQLFGRTLRGKSDTLIDYTLSSITIGDHVYSSAVIKQGGQINGLVFELNTEELEITDKYEGEKYKRIKAKLASGLESWVYASL